MMHTKLKTTERLNRAVYASV